MATPAVASNSPESQSLYQETLKDFRTYLLADKGLRPNTADTYTRILKYIFACCGTCNPTNRQLKEHIASLRESREASHSHITNKCRVVENFTAMRGDPIVLARGKKGKDTTVQSLTEGEVAIILGACKNVRERAVLSILAYSGLRNEEVCHLKVSDVDLAGQTIRIRNGKAGDGRTMMVSSRCIADIQDYLMEYYRKEDDLLFVSEKQGNPMEGATIRRIVRRVVARTNLQKRIYPHIFRHSLATNMIARGANVFAIKDILGHSDLRTTMIYLRSVDSKMAAQYEMYCPSYS